MTETPRIVTYVSLDAPPAERWLAVFYRGASRLPLTFSGPDEDVLRERAETWWQDEQEKELAKKARALHAVASKTKKVAGAETAA
jgi:hypothetical protein